MFDLRIHPHRRLNLLTREWVLVSPHRTQRPWQGQTEETVAAALPAYDPQCYLCPGNERVGGHVNPQYDFTFVFENDFAALKSDTPQGSVDEGRLLIAESEAGICRVLCFSPRHDLTMAQMSVAEIRRVVDVWTQQYIELGHLPFIHHVQIFENRGAVMGASNSHPHGQIWANATLPVEAVKELVAQQEYFQQHGKSLLSDYLSVEAQQRQRIVCENDSFVVLVPFWAFWPFETLLISRRHLTGMDQMNAQERDDLADILRRLTAAYDRLFNISFPYTMGFHQRPTDGDDHAAWHLHAHFYPPLLRSATVRKFMVGYEMLAMPQRDITPEMAASTLAACCQ
jgi:UDPglucose--hexose-1-phosphate uridylyltransferase